MHFLMNIWPLWKTNQASVDEEKEAMALGEHLEVCASVIR